MHDEDCWALNASRSDNPAIAMQAHQPRFFLCTLLAYFWLAPPFATMAEAQVHAEVDTALVLAVDVSDSVDEDRYRLQMEGIAQALEDDGVIAAITSGPKGGIALALVEWADRADVTIDWQFVRNPQDAHGVAQRIRSLKHKRGDYTCLARTLATIGESVLGTLPVPAARKVVDVSGDGIDNCDDADASDAARDALASQGVTINGLPIIVRGENDIVGAGAYRAPGYGLRQRTWGADSATTLDAWYGHHVIAGPAAFLHVARGYEDFGRAFRQKFVTEISARQSKTRHACSNKASNAVRNCGALSYEPLLKE